MRGLKDPEGLRNRIYAVKRNKIEIDEIAKRKSLNLALMIWTVKIEPQPSYLG